MTATPPQCARCAVRMRPHRSPSAPGAWAEVHAGRGLCARCYHRVRHLGQLADYPTLVRSRDDLLEDYVVLRDEGLSWRACAQRLGMRYPSFETAMCRARAAGDPRAGRPGERWPVAS